MTISSPGPTCWAVSGEWVVQTIWKFGNWSDTKSISCRCQIGCRCRSISSIRSSPRALSGSLRSGVCD